MSEQAPQFDSDNLYSDLYLKKTFAILRVNGTPHAYTNTL